MAGGRPHTSGAITVTGTSRAGQRSLIASRPVVQMGPNRGNALPVRTPPQTVGDDIAVIGLALSSLVDNFGDNAVDTAIWVNSFGTYSETGGRARVSCDAGYNAYSSGLTYTLAGSSVYLRAYPPAAGGATTEAWAQVLIKSDVGGTDLGFELRTLTGELVMFSRTGYFDAGAVAITYSPTDHAWLRIRETGGTVYWDTSPDATTWTNQRTLASPAWVNAADLEFQLIAHRSDGTNDYAEFDNVNTAPATVALTLATETDSGQALGARKALAVAAASETNTGQTLGRVKTRALSPAAETGAPQAAGKAKYKALPTPTETDTAQSPTRGKRLTTTSPSETAGGQALSHRKTRTTGPSTETDTATTPTRAKTWAVTVGQESDSGQSVTRTKTRPLAATASTETAQPVTRSKAKALGTASTTEDTQALGRSKTRAMAPAAETDTVQTLTSPGRLTAAQEADGAQQIGKAKQNSVTPASAIEQAATLDRRKARVLAPATESDTARTISPAGALSFAAEADQAMSVGKSKQLSLAAAIEVGAAPAVARTKTLAIMVAVEVATGLGPVEGQPVDDVDITVGAPYSPWTAGPPHGETWPVSGPQAGAWLVGQPN